VESVEMNKHMPVSVVSQCSLISWLKKLTSGDQRRLTGSGSALENDVLEVNEIMQIYV